MIQRILTELKQPAYRFQQIADAIFKQKIGEYDRMTILPKGIRNELIKNLGEHVLNLTPVLQKTSSQVNKVLFSIEGGERIEAVQLSYERGWKSYCISSQCGCGYGCRFCATGTIGLKRNLTADEITDQLLYFHLQGEALDSVSFMGMGEALANPYIFDARPWEHLYHVNLIPYNSTDVTPESFRQSDKDRVRKFAGILKSQGIKVTVRTQFGTDIDAACGQLYGHDSQ